MLLREAFVRFFGRLWDARNSAPQWGKLLTVIPAVWWVMALAVHDPSVRSSPAVNLAWVTLGNDFVLGWMAGVACLPVIGIGSGALAIRVFATTVSMTTWGFFLGAAAVRGSLVGPAVGQYLMLFIATAYADWRLARERVAWGGPLSTIRPR